jgi:hypothetical protein
MKMHSKGLVRLALLAAVAASFTACKKPEEPTPTPAPQAQDTEVTQSDSGTTTTYAPPAPEPQQPPSAPAQ